MFIVTHYPSNHIAATTNSFQFITDSIEKAQHEVAVRMNKYKVDVEWDPTFVRVATGDTVQDETGTHLVGTAVTRSGNDKGGMWLYGRTFIAPAEVI